jgi:hypothetical protein
MNCAMDTALTRDTNRRSRGEESIVVEASPTEPNAVRPETAAAAHSFHWAAGAVSTMDWARECARSTTRATESRRGGGHEASRDVN